MRAPRQPLALQAGLSLIELMIAMALGMGLTLAAAALMGAAKSSYIAVNDGALIQDTGRYAMELIARAIRQANYLPQDDPAFFAIDASALSPGVIGLDNSKLSSSAPALSASQSNADNHGSDVLALRYFGSGTPGQADGSMVNCVGFAAAAPADISHVAGTQHLEAERDWSIFYVAADSTGEPELRCQYLTRAHGWSSLAIARGVEAFQVLYGIAGHPDAPVAEYRNAAQMSAQQWRQVVTVRVALV